MENDRLFWVLSLALILIVGMNVMIYLALRGKKSGDATNPLSGLAKGLRNPWEAEDTAINELSDIVAKLKGRKPDNHEEHSEGNLGDS